MLLQFQMKAIATVYCQDSRLLSGACKLISSLDLSGTDTQRPQGKSLIFSVNPPWYQIQIRNVKVTGDLNQARAFSLQLIGTFSLRWCSQAGSYWVCLTTWQSFSVPPMIDNKRINFCCQRRAYILLNFAYFLWHGRQLNYASVDDFTNTDLRQQCPLQWSTFSF